MKELTNPQKSIWVTEQYYKGTSINNICGTVVLEEKIEFKKFEEAVNIVSQKHDNFKLKMKIQEEKVFQEISTEKNKIEIIEVSDIKEMKEKIEKISRIPFKLNNSLLFKFYIFKFENGQGALLCKIHHLIADAWAIALICQEIIKTYSALKNNQEADTKAISSYIDYMESEKEYLKSEKFQKDKMYWAEKFQTIPEVATIPGNKTGTIDITNAKAERKEYEISKTEVEQMKQYCKINNISLYNFFMAIYAIYISEISNLDEFVIGTPILNRTNFKEKNTLGMFINMAPLKIDLNGISDFKAFVKRIALDSLGMLKHQKYSYQTLLEDLRQKNKNIPNLYNILISYQVTNTQTEEKDIKYKTEWTFNGYCAENMDIQICDINDTGSLTISYDYKTSLYEEKEIENIHKRILNIISQVINKENIELKDIEIVTQQEKEKLLIEFNNTRLEYDETETIIHQFENQVKITPNKIAIVSNNQKLTYKQLNEKANMLAQHMIENGVKKNDIVGIMINRSQEMAIGLIAILKCGATYLPIDPEYPQERISYMLENSEAKVVLVNSKTEEKVKQKCTKVNVEAVESSNKENINLKTEANSLVYLIYTSGSTGKPKGVRITNKNLNNFVNGMKQLIDFNEDNVMVSVTTICFDIFGLEMWCSLTSGQTLIIANEEEQNNPALLNKLCLQNNVNMIQTTPSRYSVIFEDINNIKFFENITDILVGGESINEKVLQNMKENTKAKIFNVYGPTETTIWSTVKELTKEKEITIGKPIANTQCYILNKNHKILPIHVPGELYIGGDGVSEGYLKRDELNQEKFIKSPFTSDKKIYNTNDLAYYLENGDIVHLGRTDFQVKIRGFRIELGEIENAIEKNENIKQAIVIKKKLENGHDALIAYYTTKNENNSQDLNNKLKESLNDELPQYMVPQYFIKIEKMPYTPNGKIDRKELEKIELQKIDRKIIKPRNELDEELIKIVGDMLQVREVSLLDTILELGGDSLTAITLSTKILSKYNVQINIKDILSNCSIKDISDYIKENKSYNIERIEIKKAPNQDVYPLSSAQRRIYYNVKMTEDNIVYNMPGAILVEEIVEKENVKNIFEKIADRHSVLRTKFVLDNDNVVQKIEDKIEIDIPTYQITETQVNDVIKTFSEPFNLEEAPLLRVKLYYIDDKKTLILVESHHIIMDGTGLKNIITEFSKLYNGEELKEMPIEYKDYSVWENEYNESKEIKKVEDYWLNKFVNYEFAQLNLPYDYKIPANRSYKGNKISNVIDKEKFERIEKYAKDMEISPYMLFISVLFILLYKYTGQKEITLGSPIENRNMDETKEMIGMFVNNIVVKGKIDTETTFKEFVNEIKEQVLEDLVNQPYPFDMLVKKLGMNVDSLRNPLFDVLFTYQNNETNTIKLNNTECQVMEINNNISKFNLSLEVKPKTHTINIEYCTDLFKKQTIDKLFEHYMNAIECIVNDTNIKIKDINIISEAEKNKILYEFNNTELKYSKNKTITKLFEEQVNKTPNNIAIVFEDKSITYKELNQRANQLARYLRNKDIKPNDIIGIMLPRSLELLISMLGVLKSGACYIPIDPTYPEKRIEYMLENSQAKVLLTTDEMYNNISFESKISVNNKGINQLDSNNLENINNPEDLSYMIYTSGSTGLPKGVMLKHKSLSNLCADLNQNVEFLQKDNKYKNIVSVTTSSFDIFIFETLICLQKGLKIILANEDEQRIPALLDKLIENNNGQIIQMTPSRMQIFLDNIEQMPHLSELKYVTLAGEALPLHLRDKLVELGIKKVYNGYGPSETTVFSTFTDVTECKEINIGVPLANTQMYILDKNLQIVPIGVAGELYIAGDGVGKGYLNREDITKERYIENPFLENSIMYKTGDICKFDKKGEIYYLGRADNQVKVRGLRIELEEIENRILENPYVKKAKVVKQVIGNREIISAYFIAKRRIRTSELRKHLQNTLPNYMVPSYFTALDEFPYTPNGKIDKNALPIPSGMLQNKKEGYVKPKTDLEVKLVSIWEEILNTKPIGIKDNFFELGGDSILAMNLNIKLLNITDKIKYSDIFTYPTITELSEKIQTELQENKKEDLSKLVGKYEEILENCMNLPQEIQRKPINNILLTGVTGYLGIHILEEFLKKEKGKIYVLIRKDPGSTVKEKLLDKMHYYFGEKYDKYVDDRIIIVQGEIVEDGFGLNQEEVFNLANSIDSIINSAAKVSHYGSYLEFYNTNVKSVEKIVDFANAFNKRIFHVSTLSVSGNAFVDQYYMEQEFKEKIEFKENNLYVGQKLENVYIKSKFEAEKKILDAILKGLDAYILRVGNLMPRLSDGKFQENIDENAYISRLKTFNALGYIPEYLTNGYLEFTPIDSTAQSILKIMQYTNKENRIYHVFNHNHVYLKDLLKAMKELNNEIQVISNEEFKQNIKSILKSKNSVILNTLINDLDKDLNLNYDSKISLNSEQSIELLRLYGFKWPKIDKRYLMNILMLIKGEENNDNK